jgi:DNA-binding response OmpR family regulator
MKTTSKHTPLRVIIVEDEPKLLENLVIGLTHHGFEVTGVVDGSSLDAALALKPADVIVLDLGLPGEDGIEIAKRVRESASIGLIMVTARGLIEDRIIGFESGADVYFVKPVDIIELAAAIKSLGRRVAPPCQSKWQIEMESSSLLTPEGIRIRLNAQEAVMLQLFLTRVGKDVARPELLKILNLPNEISFYPRLDVLISRLRTKVLKQAPLSPLPIQTRYSRGYAFLKETDRE